MFDNLAMFEEWSLIEMLLSLGLSQDIIEIRHMVTGRRDFQTPDAGISRNACVRKNLDR
jgi:hypothetical protein